MSSRRGVSAPVAAASTFHRMAQEVPDTVVIAYIGRSNGAGPTLSAMSTIPVITVPASVKEFPDDLWSSLRAPSNEIAGSDTGYWPGGKIGGAPRPDV